MFNSKLENLLVLKKNKLFVFLFFMVFSSILHSQQYSISIKKLNVREKADKTSKVIGACYINDTVSVFSKEGNWLKIKLDNKDGYINADYATEIKLRKNQKVEKGFKSGFKKVFFNSFVILCLIFIMYNSYKKRIDDSRYKTGFREGKISIREYLTYGTYSLIISLTIGLISGIVTWISTF